MTMRKPYCRFNLVNQNKDADLSMTQYSALSNEYVNLMHGAQTVITINLAVSIGVLAILATLICNGGSLLIYAACSLCAFIGLFGAVSCIRTIYASRKLIINIESNLHNIEKTNGLYSIREVTYYKPLHITTEAFYVFAFIFNSILSISLLNLINSCYNHILIPINWWSIIITFLALCTVILVSIFVSNVAHKCIKNHLIKQLK